jgi:transposase-like protein
LLQRNPCTVRGAGVSHAGERSVATVAQVNGLAEAVPLRYRARAPPAHRRSAARGVMQAYVVGVSTRRVDDLVVALGGTGISRSEVSWICASPTSLLAGTSAG